VELSTYGFVTGILREKFNLRVLWSIIVAMIFGRLTLFLVILVTFLIIGESYSPLGVETSPIFSLWAVIRQGWPGIVIQLVLIPPLIWLLSKLIDRMNVHNGQAL